MVGSQPGIELARGGGTAAPGPICSINICRIMVKCGTMNSELRFWELVAESSHMARGPPALCDHPE